MKSRILLGVLLLLLLVYDHQVFSYNVAVNSNRKFLFGDVLEPLCSIDTSGDTLSKSDVIQLFHVWENYTSSQISVGSLTSLIADYRKAMPCFPGPSLNIDASNEDLIPPYPNCDTFVNISTTTIEEVEDLMNEMKKEQSSQQMDVSLKSVVNSLSNRLQNLVDFLPEGETKGKVEAYLSTLHQMSTQPYPSLPFDNSTRPPPHHNHSRHYSNPPHPRFNPSDLLSCFNIFSFSPMDLLSLSGQTIGTVACSQFQICSFSDLTQNSCLSSLNVTEDQYNSVINKTVGEVLKSKIGGAIARKFDKIGSFFNGITRRDKRTPSPFSDESDYEDVTPLMKMDGREESSEDGSSSEEVSNSTDTQELLDFVKNVIKPYSEKAAKLSPGDYSSLPPNALCSYLDELANGTKCEKDSKIAKDSMSEVEETRQRGDSEVVRNSTDSEGAIIQDGSGEGSGDDRLDLMIQLLDSRRPEDSEDVPEPKSETQELQKHRDTEDVINSLESDVLGAEGSGEGSGEDLREELLGKIDSRRRVDSEDIRPQVSDSENVLNSTIIKDLGDKNFNQALSFFKTEVATGTENLTSSDSNDVIPELQNLLNTTLNSSMLEYGSSFLNDTTSDDLKQKISAALSNLGSEFTISQLLTKLDIRNQAILNQLVQLLKSVLGNEPGFSEISSLVGKLSGSGMDIQTVLKMINSGGSSSSSSLLDTIKGKLSSSKLSGTDSSSLLDTVKEKLSSKSPELAKILGELVEASTIPGVLQNALNSTNSSIVSDFLKSNPSILEKFNLGF